jgi:hypothetical protein
MMVNFAVTFVGLATFSRWLNGLFDQAQTSAKTPEPSRPVLDDAQENRIGARADLKVERAAAANR